MPSLVRYSPTLSHRICPKHSLWIIQRLHPHWGEKGTRFHSKQIFCSPSSQIWSVGHCKCQIITQKPLLPSCPGFTSPQKHISTEPKFYCWTSKSKCMEIIRKYEIYRLPALSFHEHPHKRILYLYVLILFFFFFFKLLSNPFVWRHGYKKKGYILHSHCWFIKL